MYLSFYGLKKQPFHLTPDPEFLYLSPSHKEALAAIIYGIEERKGFVAITGAVGAGKTTILRSYLESAERKRLKIIYIFNAKLTFEGLLKTIYRELNLPLEGSDVVEMVNALLTVKVTAAVCAVLPPVPVTVMGYEPAAAVEATAMVTVEAPEPGAAIDGGLKLTVTPAG